MLKIDLNLDYSAILDRLNKAKSGFKNVEWAKKIGVKPNVITNIHGKTRQNPSMEYIIAVSRVTNRPIEYYLWGTSSSENKEHTQLNVYEECNVSQTSLNERLKIIRNHLQFNQKQMAESLSISISAYQNYERGEREIPTKLVAKLTTYGFESKWLLTGEGEMFVQSSQQESRQEHPKPIDKETEIKQLLKQTEQVLKSDNQMIYDNLKQNIEQSSYTLEIEAQLNSFKKKSRE